MIFVKDVVVLTTAISPLTGIVMSAMEEKVDLAIKFYHDIRGTERHKGRATRCELIIFPCGEKLTYDNGEVIADGATKVFSGNQVTKHDQFDRRIGRFESLSRALEASGLEKEARAQIWKSYIDACKLPPKRF